MLTTFEILSVQDISTQKGEPCYKIATRHKPLFKKSYTLIHTYYPRLDYPSERLIKAFDKAISRFKQ